MNLAKKRETLWVIDKENYDSKILLKLIESPEKINVEISINKKDDKISFIMDVLEFQKFFKILKSFKELIEENNNKETDIPNVEDKSQNIDKNIEEQRNKTTEWIEW